MIFFATGPATFDSAGGRYRVHCGARGWYAWDRRRGRALGVYESHELAALVCMSCANARAAA